jgi:hypothetical protein
MDIRSKIANHPRAAVALITSVFAACGALWLALLLVPCVAPFWLQPQIGFLFCMSKYIAKSADFAYPVAMVSACLTIGAIMFLASNKATSQKPPYCAFLATVGGVFAYPVAAGLAVILLRQLDPYWAGVQLDWMYNRLLRGGFWMSWRYALPGAAIAGCLASLIVKAAVRTRRTVRRPVRDRRWFRLALALLAAPFAASIFVAVVLTGVFLITTPPPADLDWGSVMWAMIWYSVRIFFTALVFALPGSILLGGPLNAQLSGRVQPRMRTAILGGACVGVLGGVFGLYQVVSGFGPFGLREGLFSFDFLTTQLAPHTVLFVAAGGVGGIVFWLCAMWREPRLHLAASAWRG